MHLPNFSATTGDEAGNVDEVRGDISDPEKTKLEASNVGAKPTQEDKLPIASLTDFSIENFLGWKKDAKATNQPGKLERKHNNSNTEETKEEPRLYLFPRCSCDRHPF